MYTLADILADFDPATVARGEACARNDKVLSMYQDGAAFAGEVEGSHGEVYEVDIEVATHFGVDIRSTCTCPVGDQCKHAVAILLVGLSQGWREADEATPVLPANADRWLKQLAMLQASLEGPVPTRRGAYRLVYVLMPNRHNGAPHLHLCKARLRKDGIIAAASLHQDRFILLAGQPEYMTAEDEEPVRLLAALQAGKPYQEVYPAGRLGARLLAQLCQTGQLFWADSVADLKRGQLIPVEAGPLRQAQLGWHQEQDGAAVRLGWRFDDGASVGHVLPTDPMVYLDGALLGELALPASLDALPPKALLDAVAQAPRLQPEQRTPMAMVLTELGLDRLLPPPQELSTRRRADIAPVPCLLLDAALESVRRQGLEWHDFALLSFEYDGMRCEVGDPPLLRRPAGHGYEVIERNLPAEAAAAAELAALGLRPHGPSFPLAYLENALALPSQSAWLSFARDGLPRLHEAGWRIELGGNYRYEVSEVEDWYAELDEQGGEADGWFALDLGIVVDGERTALLPLLLEMIRNAPDDFSAAALAARGDGDDVVADLPDGRRVVLPWTRIGPILSTLGELYLGERTGDALRLPLASAARLAELERAAQLRWMGGERLRELGRKLDAFDGMRPVPAPAGLQASLRPYQQAGLTWMQFLREYDFGGILADDMGLGKTIQTLAHILAEKEAGRLDAPALVVAPTSLMGNWQAEAARFAPGLRVVLLHGKDRAERFGQVAGADLVLSTYALLARDEAELRKQRYHLLILDEAQYIKNSRSKAAQVARLLDARHRLCLTGTPVQNHLGELWSQFHFLMPGLLGEEKAFNAGFRKPIEQQGDSFRKELLARRVKPFMLRRTKDKVATELPPKTEIVLPIELGSAQRDLYETVRLAMDRKVRAEIDRKGLARSQIVILDALLKLRQVCCDPRLLKSGGAAGGSAKLDALMELLDTLLSEGRKVLVFSQFTSMLALIEQQLLARAVAFAVLTGETVDRAGAVAAFQQGEAAVFLISLKAGGVGLNLTAADTVIHYDPWWNPASENQATDRAWRIGQEQPVFVYKLIARGTLEEKIQEMQRRKGALADALLEAEGGLSGAIDADDLRAIFAPAAA